MMHPSAREAAEALVDRDRIEALAARPLDHLRQRVIWAMAILEGAELACLVAVAESWADQLGGRRT